MNLYQVYNGYMANAPISVIVLAPDEARARQLASDKFKAELSEGEAARKTGFWEKGGLEVNFLAAAGSEFVSEVDEG